MKKSDCTIALEKLFTNYKQEKYKQIAKNLKKVK